jgi:hypothetical protein
MRAPFLLSLSVTALCGLITNNANGQDVPSPDESSAIEVVSLSDATLANWIALENYDVVWTVDEFYTTPSGKTVETTTINRMLADFVDERFLFIGSRKVTAMNSGDNQSGDSRAVSAFVYDGTTAWHREIPEPPRKLISTTLFGALARSYFPDVRLVGILQSPRRFFEKHSIEDTFRVKFHLGKKC